MYTGFNLQIGSKVDYASVKFKGDYESELLKVGKEVHAGHKAQVKKVLDDFALGGGALDAAKMQASWFPAVSADVFVSHSHANEQEALRLSGWMKRELGVTCFIDSAAWGYSDELLRLIDDSYCYTPSTQTYVYAKRNRSTSHVHMMLATALSKMIDKCECVLFLNTPDSLTPKDVVEGAGASGASFSPWLYFEISTTRIVQRRTPAAHRDHTLVKKAMDEANLTLLYEMPTDHLTKLTTADLKNWWDAPPKGHPLDRLYAVVTVTK
jgi:hypothetical protein